MYNTKECDKCGKVYTPSSATQKWCQDCLTKRCIYCNKEYSIAKKSIYETSKFCSRECKGLYRSTHYIGENASNYKNGNRILIQVKCDYCNELMMKEKQHIDKWEKNFCNRKCQANYYKDHPLKGENNPKYSKVTVICEWCEKEYKTYKSTSDKTRFCSNQCRGNWQSEMMKGSNHPNWSGGIAEKRSLSSVSREYKKWRNDVFKRDNFTCQSCGDNKGGNLNAHHIKSYKNNPELRTTLSNGITLCETCHIETHKKIKLDIQSELTK